MLSYKRPKRPMDDLDNLVYDYLKTPPERRVPLEDDARHFWEEACAKGREHYPLAPPVVALAEVLASRIDVRSDETKRRTREAIRRDDARLERERREHQERLERARARWRIDFPDFPPRIGFALAYLGLTPANLPYMDDAAILKAEGVGRKWLATIRTHHPRVTSPPHEMEYLTLPIL